MTIDDDPLLVAEGACRDGPMILLATASGKEEVQCQRCGLIMPKDRNMEYLFGFKVNCEGEKT